MDLNTEAKNIFDTMMNKIPANIFLINHKQYLVYKLSWFIDDNPI